MGLDLVGLRIQVGPASPRAIPAGFALSALKVGPRILAFDEALLPNQSDLGF